MTRRIAVTGASGFIGRNLVAALTADGDVAVPIARPFVRDRLTRELAGVDALIHLAGVVSAPNERDFFAANLDATRVVAEAARDAGVRMIHISSLAAAGPAAPGAPRSETDAEHPINAYGRSKLEGERAVAATAGLRWTTLRPGVVYGPGDRALRPLFRAARLGILPVVGNPDAAYTFIYVADVIRALRAAVDRSLDGRTIFLGHPRPVTARALIEVIRSAAGTSALVVPIPRPVTRLAAAIGDVAGALTGRPATINRRRFGELYSEGFVCRIDRMREQLGVEAETDLRAGLVRAADWYLRTTRRG